MNTLEQQVDSAVEFARAQDVDAIGFGADHVYDSETWHLDCGDFLVADSEYENNLLRKHLANMLFWVDAMEHVNAIGLAGSQMRAVALCENAQRVGFAILENAMKNGLTLKNVGVVL